MKPYLFFLVFFISLSAVGQQDSLHFVRQKWETKEIKKGIIWKKAHFSNLFNSQQQINIVEIDLKKHHKNLKLAGHSAKLEFTSDMAKNNDALVAINGGFFDMKNGGATDFIRIDNQVINTDSNKSARAISFLAFDKKKVIITDNESAAKKNPNVLLAGPFLMLDKQISKLAKNAFNDNRHPRTAIGVKNNKKLVMITVDGRNAKAQGVNLYELTNILSWLGCTDAMNLDGGGSTTMYIKDQPDNGVVNYPSDNKKFDHSGEREVANIIYIKN